MKTLVLLAFIVGAASAAVFTNDVMAQRFAEKNMVMKCKELGLTMTLDMVERAKLTGTLARGGPFTLFAPTDAAWNALPPIELDDLKLNITGLTMLLQYHLYSGKFMSSMIEDEKTVPTLLGKSSMIRFNTYDMGLVTATGAPISKADQMASNGVIHVIDKVMWPVPKTDITTLVATEPHFKTLFAAVQAAELGETLKGDALTIFAPTDDAFAKIPTADLNSLLSNKTALTNVLTYHVVPKTYFAASLKDGMMVKTACTSCPSKLTVHIDDMGAMINDAKVIFADEAMTNGVMHVIDTVLMP